MNSSSNRDSHRGKTSMRLIGTLRGDGKLNWEGGSAKVAYALDLYEGRSQKTGSGSLDGPLARLARAALTAGSLTLEDGFQMDVALFEIDADGAMFETRGPVPDS